MSKKITPNMLLIGLGLIGLIGLFIIGYTTLKETIGSAPSSTTTTKTPPLRASSVARSPNVKDKPVTGQIVIKFKPQYTDAQIAEHLKLYHATISRRIQGLNQTVVKVPAGQENTIVEKLKDDGFADEAVRDYTTHALDSPNDAGFVNQWALNNTGQTIEGSRGGANDDVRAEAAWGMSQGNGVRVAILDTGINLSHPDLTGKVVAQKVFITNSIEDNNGHGTHVAGIIAANT
ncbi:MAG: S8 family serine peptidase, partial [Candidatus Levyibacteriota bacterium]